jgi:hypothetical protein
LSEKSPAITRNCERAVVTAYRELRACGTLDMQAFHACTTLYRIHHPEASISEARCLVSEWIDHHVVRQAEGRTSGCDCDCD